MPGPFVRLTTYSPEPLPVLVNLARVTHMQRHADDTRTAIFFGSDKLEVAEPPEEIVQAAGAALTTLPTSAAHVAKATDAAKAEVRAMADLIRRQQSR